MHLSEKQRMVRKRLLTWKYEKPFVKIFPSFQCPMKTYTIGKTQAAKEEEIYLFALYCFLH